MLEEAIKDDKRGPAEVALAMLTFVQQELPAGGTSAENRFYHLYVPLCNRIFGPLITKPKDNKDLFRHKEGGWLSARYAWSRYPSSQQQPQQHHQTIRNAAASIQNASSIIATGSSGKKASSGDVDPVIKFLGTTGMSSSSSMDSVPPTLIETICLESVNRPGWGIELPFDALPSSCRDSWLATLKTEEPNEAAKHMLTESTRILLTKLLRRGPMEQKELVQYQQRKSQNQQHVSMMKMSPRGFHSPIGMKGSAAESSVNNKASDQIGKAKSPKVVLSMLEYYLFLFLRFPMAKPIYPAVQGFSSSSSHYREREPYGDSVYFSLFLRYLRHFLPYGSRSLEFQTKNRESQLFLRSIIMMWMETQGKVKTTKAVTESILERQRRSGMPEPYRFDLNSAYDLISVRFEAPVALIQKCLRQVVLRLVLDPRLSKQIVREQDWTMPKAMEAFTQPFYNYIRATFRHATLHQDNSSFYTALDCWLLWLEPWNVEETFRTGKPPKRHLKLPKAYNPSRYHIDWEKYIAANVHVFATPLSIFLRRARELEFSTVKHDKSMKTIRKVFRVFTPAVVDAVSRHLNMKGTQFPILVQQHQANLGPYAPPTGLQALTSCQGDMKGLVEEVYSQCRKRKQEMSWVDRLEYWFSSTLSDWFKGAVTGDDPSVKIVLTHAKIICELPASYSPLDSSQSAETSAASNSQTIETVSADGVLTDEGFRALVTGASKSDPFAVGLVGGPENARLGSYEVDWILELTKLLSQAVLEKTGYRVSFRFLADYRNLLLLSLMFLVWWRWWW